MNLPSTSRLTHSALHRYLMGMICASTDMLSDTKNQWSLQTPCSEPIGRSRIRQCGAILGVDIHVGKRRELA